MEREEGAKVNAGLNFPAALRLVQSGCQVRRAGWAEEKLFIGRNADGLDRVDMVREGFDGAGPYIYAEPWLGGSAIGGPPVEDLLAQDWQVVEDPRVPTEEGGERAQAAELAEIDAEGEESGRAAGAVGCGARR